MSGWNNSYNNEPFKSEEVAEYVNNAYLKLSTYIDKTTDMLEVGVGSGMFAFKMSGACHCYDGCDISQNVLDILKNESEKRGISNMLLYCLGADEIDSIGRKYDIILMSSVTEYFSGYNYLQLVVEKSIETLKDIFPQITNIAVTNKIGFADNEINRYRYDVLIEVDKTIENKAVNKKQFGFENGRWIY